MEERSYWLILHQKAVDIGVRRAEMTNPDIAIVSSIGPQHLETFKTIENVQKTKMELVEYAKKDGTAI